MEAKKFYIGSTGHVHVICSQCGRERRIEIRNIPELNKKYKVKCPCGNEFLAQFEQRRQFRKSTDLVGTCRRIGGTDHPDIPIRIKDLSKSGVGFVTNDQEILRPGDVLELRIVLDNPYADNVVCKAVVKIVKERNFIGAEFVDVSEYLQKQLGFYMMK